MRIPRQANSVRRLFGGCLQQSGRTLAKLGRKRDRRRSVLAPQETLEPRLALTVSVFEQPVVAGRANWTTVAIDNGSDLYLQHATNINQDLLIADNSSFANRTAIPNFQTQYDQLLVYEGSDTAVANVRTPNYPYVRNAAGLYSDTMLFAVPYTIVNPQFPINGVLTLPGGRTIGFTNSGSGTNFTITSGGLGGIVGVLNQNQSYGSSLQLSSAAFLGLAGTTEPPTLTLDFSNGTANLNGTERSRTIARNIPAASDGGNTFRSQLVDMTPDPATGIAPLYVPGSLSGVLEVQFEDGTRSASFQVETTEVSDAVPLSFGDSRAAFIDYVIPYNTNNFSSIANQPRVAGGTFRDTVVRVTGTYDAFTGGVTLSARIGYFIEIQGVLGQSISFISISGRAPVSLGIESARLGLYSASTSSLPPSVTLFPGQVHSVSLTVELPSPGAAISVESPIVTASGGGQGTISFAASQITVDAPVFAANRLVVPNAVDTAMNTISEQVTFNAATSAPVFVIELADDDRTGDVSRSRLVVGQTGSLSGRADVLNPVAGALPRAGRTFVSVTDGDIFIEGEVAATTQAYSLSSAVGSEFEAPFVFTTESRVTGIATGKLSGNVLSVSLANDTLGPTYSSITESRMSLTTAVDRLRVQAASRAGDALDFPFPYAISIREDDSLIIDAVAASSGPMVLETGNTLDLLASVRTANDIIIRSGDDFNVQAPIYTSFGSVGVSAPQITVNGPIRILDGVQDEDRTDVLLDASEGGLVLNDAVIGLNRVRLRADGPNGAITGTARVTGDIVDAFSTGGVSLRTAANLVAVDAGGDVRVDEEDAAFFDVRRSPFVTLIANGVDTAVTRGGRDHVSPALFADVVDAGSIVVSAPRGSIDVLHSGSRPLVIGNQASIQGETNDPMLAGGSVVIRSSLTDELEVLDAPLAASGAVEVKTVSTLPLSGTYTAGASGVNAAIVRAEVNFDPTTRRTIELEQLEIDQVRPGDRILVRAGVDNPDPNATDPGDRANGIYVVIRKQFSEAGKAELVLARSTAYDETAELEGRHYVRVTDGRLRGAVFVSEGFASRNAMEPNPTPVVVRPVVSQPGYVVARATTTAPLSASEARYSTSASGASPLGTVFATIPGAIAGARRYFNNVVLGVGDLVLLRDGVLDAQGKRIPASSGLYKVRVAGNATTAWQLDRYAGADDDGDGVQDALYLGIVAVNEGSLRTSLSGEMFEISYDALHHDALTYTQLVDFQAATSTTPATVFDPMSQIRVDIGTENPNGVVNFVVNTAAGRNDSSGSLGKMLTLLQANTAFTERTGRPQAYEVTVAAAVRDIVLEQALPAITKPIDINGLGQVFVDGSRIEYTQDGAVVRSAGPALSLGPVFPSQVRTSRKLVRTVGPSSVSSVDGLRIASSADGTIIRNIALGGFRSGSAIRIDGAENVLVDNVTLGRRNGATNRDPRVDNKVGITLTGMSAADDARYSTILNSVIVGSREVGVLFDAGANDARIVGSRIGDADHDNAVGIQVHSGEGRNLVGAAPIQPAASISGVPLVPQTASTATVPRNAATALLRTGHQLYDRAGNRLWAIDSVEERPGDLTSFLVTLSGPSLPVAVNGSSISVEAGYFSRVVARAELITLPAGVNRDDLFLGQVVTGSVDNVFGQNTQITSIEAGAGGQTVIGLSRPVTLSAMTAVFLGEAARNVVNFNGDGIKITSGEVRIVATDVSNSVFDGIQIAGMKSGGIIEIGGVDGRTLSVSNASINSNGLAGIHVMESFFAGLATDSEKRARMNQLTIWGNFLGTDIESSAGKTNGTDGASNIVIGDPMIEQEFIARLDRGADGRYLATYRPEDDKVNPDLADFVDRDRNNNFHFTGDPVTLPGGAFGGGSYGDGGVVRLPTRR